MRAMTRADVFERQRRTVKQFERVDLGFDFNKRDRKIERRGDDRFETVASISPRVNGRSARMATSVSVRPGRRDKSQGVHGSIVSGT
jgi:hypothetical protein